MGKLAIFIKGINYLTAIAFIIVGILKYATFSAVSLSPAIFIPAFLIIFGILLIMSEMQVKFILNYCKFLQNYMGRGLFNIYIATLMSDDSYAPGPKIVCYVISLCLVFIGVSYMIMFCVKGKDRSDMEEGLNSGENQY